MDPKNRQQHSATPWHVSNRYYVYADVNLEGEKGARIICDTKTSPDYTPNEVQEENAAFIVRAVNAHDELVEALRKLISIFDDPHHVTDSRVIAAARTAIAKAEGRAP